MERWAGRVALVTGASQGIGEAVAINLVRHGMKVVGCARNLDKLQILEKQLVGSNGRFYPHKCDLSIEAEIIAMFDRLRSEFGGVDVCVNNAGLSFDAPLLTGDTKQWRYMTEVNVLALLTCSRESIKSMRDRGVDDGHVIMVSSMSGHRIEFNKRTHYYAATKHSVRAITEGIRQELREINSHIRVTAISPGNVNTNFPEQMGKDFDKTAFHAIENLESKDIADTIAFVLQTPRHVEIHDILMRPVEQVS